MDLKQECSACRQDGVGPWLSMCPFCGTDRQPLFSLDEDGFLCEVDGDRILDETHWILDFCERWEWQAFCVSRDGDGAVRGLRRTCMEWNDNANEGWCHARKTVLLKNPTAFSKMPRLALKCAKIMRSSLFHVWPTIPRGGRRDRPRDDFGDFNRFETDYYVNLGLMNGENISRGSFVMEKDTLHFVRQSLHLSYERNEDAAVGDMLNFIGDMQWTECLGKDRPDDYDLSGRLVDRWSVPLVILKPEDKLRLDDMLFATLEGVNANVVIDPPRESPVRESPARESPVKQAFVPGFLDKRR